MLCCAVLPLPQVYDILNSLEDRLGVNSSAVVLAAMKVHSSTVRPHQCCTQLHLADGAFRFFYAFV